MLMEQSRNTVREERAEVLQKAKEMRAQAEALLVQASRDAARAIREAEQKAEQIGGDAYTALREKELLEQSIKAIRNVVEGYGDRYVVPTHSLLDDLAED